MRVRLALSVNGEIRAQLLRDELPKVVPLGGDEPPLVSSSEVQELTTSSREKLRPGFGKLAHRAPFGKAARSTVKGVGAVLDRVPPRRCVFLTGTLPGGSPAALRALAEWSGWMVQTVQQWVRDYAEGSQFFGVWEWQKRGALHLHVVVACRGEVEVRRLKARWKARWVKALVAISKRSGVDLFERIDGTTWWDEKWRTRCDVQTVQQSVTNYLAKYLSKGADKNRKRTAYPPSAWYFSTRELREQRTQARRVVTVRDLQPSAALTLFERLSSLTVSLIGSAFYYRSPVDALVAGVVVTISPVAASLWFDTIAPLLRSLQPGEGIIDHSEVVPLRVVAQLFGGRLLQSTA